MFLITKYILTVEDVFKNLEIYVESKAHSLEWFQIFCLMINNIVHIKNK